MGNASRMLKYLYSLDASSPDFLRFLRFLIRYDEGEQHLISLEEPELTRLLDFLDKVRAVLSSICQFRDGPLQALDIIPTSDVVVTECLKKLQTICTHRGTLPSSCILSGELARGGHIPVAANANCELWKGTYHDKQVCIFSYKTPLGNYCDRVKVRIRYCLSSSRLLMDILGCCRRSSRRSSR